MIQEQG